MQMETNNNIFNHLKVNPKPEVEESYFNEFADNLMNELKLEKRSLRISYRSVILWVSSVAAIALLVFTFKFNQKNDEINLSQLSKKEIHDYLIQHVDELEDESLIGQETTIITTPSQLSKDEILDYLENEDLDVEF